MIPEIFLNSKYTRLPDAQPGPHVPENKKNGTAEAVPGRVMRLLL
jgi:hypothetical protein